MDLPCKQSKISYAKRPVGENCNITDYLLNVKNIYDNIQ